LRDQFWPNRGFQNPITTDLKDKIPDHGAHFTTERPLVVKKTGFGTFRNFPISAMPGLFVQGCEQPRLERGRSSIGTDGPVGGDPRSYLRANPEAPDYLDLAKTRAGSTFSKNKNKSQRNSDPRKPPPPLHIIPMPPRHLYSHVCMPRKCVARALCTTASIPHWY